MTKEITNDKDIKGFKHFIHFMNSQLPVWSLVIVNDSVDSIVNSGCLDDLEDANDNGEIKAQLFGDERDECEDKIDSFIPIVKVKDNWSIIYLSICVNSNLAEGVRLSESISLALNKKVIYFCAEDTSMLTAYRVFEKGKQVGEEYTWQQLENYDEPLDDEFAEYSDPDTIERFNEANNFFVSENIYIPVCYVAEDDSGKVWLATTKASRSSIESVTLIPSE
jgi:hypothetical protein